MDYKYLIKENEIRLSFPYDKGLVDICRMAPKRKFDPTTKEWIFPLTKENLDFLKEYLPHPDLEKVKPPETEYDVIQTSYIWARVVNPFWEGVLKEKLGYHKYYWVKTIWGMEKCREWISMITRKGWFLAGLIPEIKSRWKELKIKEIDYKPKLKEPNLKGIELRDYQKRIIREIVERKRGIIESPTGSGKTVTAAGIISSFQNSSCLFIVHTRPLLTQTSEELSRLLEVEAGKIGGGEFDIRKITVATIQTLSKMERNEIRKIGKMFNIVIVDEAHHCHADSYQNVLGNLEVPIRIGLTATPHKLWSTEEYMRATGMLGPIVARVTYRELINKGFAPEVEVWLIRHSNFSEGSWHEVYKKGIVKNVKRNEIISNIALEMASKKKTVLIHVTRVDHGQELLKFLDSKAELVTGQTNKEIQEKIKKSLKKKNQKIAICTTVWKEGVDIPSLDCVIYAAGGKSEISTIQAVGRALRPKEGKAIVVDFLDIGAEYLQEHSEKRREIYEALEWKVKTIDEKEWL